MLEGVVIRNRALTSFLRMADEYYAVSFPPRSVLFPKHNLRKMAAIYTMGTVLVFLSKFVRNFQNKQQYI